MSFFPWWIFLYSKNVKKDIFTIARIYLCDRISNVREIFSDGASQPVLNRVHRFVEWTLNITPTKKQVGGMRIC